MRANFDKSYDIERRYEGGNVDHPADPGGRTSRGVIQRVYDGYRSRNGLPLRDVFKATEAEIKAIYRLQYWDVIRGDELPSGIDLVVFDGAVNSGPRQSVKWLQRALKVQRVDGQIGEATLGACKAAKDHDAIIASICDQRMAFLKQLRHWPTFRKGWTARVSNLRKIGQAWAAGSVGPPPTPVAPMEGGSNKAEPEDISKPTVAPETSGAATAGGGIITGALTELQQQLAPYSDTLKIVGYVCIAITVGLAGYTIYSFIRSRKIKSVTATP